MKYKTVWIEYSTSLQRLERVVIVEIESIVVIYEFELRCLNLVLSLILEMDMTVWIE